MKWVLTAWQLVRDILLTGAGLWLIVRQGLAQSPDSALIVTGLALTVPAAATHTLSVLSGSPGTLHGRPSSSESAPPSSSSPSSPPRGSGEPGAEGAAAPGA